MGTGFDAQAFELDVSTLNGTQVLDGDGEDFQDITEFANNITISRGRKQVLDAFGAGTMIVSMDQTNNERELDAFNTSSIYYNTSTDQPTATSVQTSSARLSAVLALVPYTGTTSITGTPTATLGAYTIAQDTNANSYVNRINQAEQGRIFVSRAGVLTFQPRIGATLAAVTVTFNDTGTGTKYDNLGVEFDQQAITNSATVTIESGGTPQTSTDAASIAEYFKQSLSIDDSLLSSNAQALTLSDYLLDPIPEPRFTSMSSTFAALTDSQKTALATIEIGGSVTLTKTFPNGTPIAVTQALAIEGIDHKINVASGHRVTLYTSQTVVLNAFVLNDITYGTLDEQNALT
ncbi:MAG: hypothetical protein EBR82_52910 [Caulobacteraceae bacterium]|nr:hypothetical protein [Caulobacteraceae bacterium]